MATTKRSPEDPSSRGSAKSAEPAPKHVDYIAAQQRRERLRAKLRKAH
jgi:hypothetical protein